MVSVSAETPEEIDVRLRTVIGRADLVVHPGSWSFVESALHEPPSLDPDVLAVVRDEQSWSALRPHRDPGGTTERFGVFSFHFPPGLDNSGFIGWLASALKRELGTGVFVICGSNTERGGIYDYWGCPFELLDQAVDVVRSLAD
ncbi:MAG: hypothetical protein JWR83_1633 [Aeromicrobium sp.]|nr:hypothetical protein [Aeromicrobium sp.]